MININNYKFKPKTIIQAPWPWSVYNITDQCNTVRIGVIYESTITMGVYKNIVKGIWTPYNEYLYMFLNRVEGYMDLTTTYQCFEYKLLLDYFDTVNTDISRIPKIKFHDWDTIIYL